MKEIIILILVTSALVITGEIVDFYKKVHDKKYVANLRRKYKARRDAQEIISKGFGPKVSFFKCIGFLLYKYVVFTHAWFGITWVVIKTIIYYIFRFFFG